MSNPDEAIENEFLIGGNERRAIVLVDYDPSWSVRFQGERAKLTTALGTEAIRIEHIGSTAVPGLAAKPIIDVLVTVDDMEDESRYLVAVGARVQRRGVSGLIDSQRSPTGKREMRHDSPPFGLHIGAGNSADGPPSSRPPPECRCIAAHLSSRKPLSVV